MKNFLFLSFLCLATISQAQPNFTNQRTQSHTIKLSNSIDSLSYLMGIVQAGQGLSEYIASLGIEDEYIDHFVKGVRASAKECSKEEQAYIIGIEIGNQAKNQMIHTIDSIITGEEDKSVINKSLYLDAFCTIVKRKKPILDPEEIDIDYLLNVVKQKLANGVNWDGRAEQGNTDIKLDFSSGNNNDITIDDDNTIYEKVEQMPEFPGGISALGRFLSTHIRYPTEAEENGIQGRVILKFIVEKNGKISNIKVLKSIDPFLDREAIRVVNSMPNWKPGIENGKYVRVEYVLPVTFRLQ